MNKESKKYPPSKLPFPFGRSMVKSPPPDPEVELRIAEKLRLVRERRKREMKK